MTMATNFKTNPQKDAVLLAQNSQKVSPNSRLIWDYKNSLPLLDLFQLEMCVGLLLGDASMERSQSKTTHRLRFEWGDKHQFYAKSVYEVLSLYCLTSPRMQIRESVNKVPVTTWCFQTVSVPAFNKLAEAFLSSEGKKRLNLDLLSELISPVSLAYWYIDDGHRGSANRYGMYLNTQAFTEAEAQGLCNIIKTKFNLEGWVQSKESRKNQPYIVISGHSYSTFFSQVQQYIHPSMRHKFPIGSRTQWHDLNPLTTTFSK